MSGPTRGMVAGQAIQTQAQTKEFDEGYERIFGKERQAGRGRYRYDADAGQVVAIDSDWTDTESRAQTPTEGIVYGNAQATDGADLSSRRKHRDYMKANGLSMAGDFKEHWQKKAKEREEVLSGRAGSKERREILGRTLHEMRQKGKR